MIEPRTHEPPYWESVAKDWCDRNPDTLWRTHSDAVNWSLFSRWLPDTPRSKRLLKTDQFDEAANRGAWNHSLSERAERVIGLDLSLTILSQAHRFLADPTSVCGDARALPFADESFDVVVSNSTLDHFSSERDFVASLREMRRVLNKNGELLITMDNRSNPFVALRNALPYPLLHRLGLVPYYVGVTFTYRSLRRILQLEGFDVREMDVVMHCPRVLAVGAARLLARYASAQVQETALRSLMACERLGRWPTRRMTGYFLAARAVKSSA